MQRYISTSFMLVLLGLVVLWAGCSRPATELTPTSDVGDVTLTTPTARAGATIPGAPEWFFNIPEDPNYFYAAATHSSKVMQLALDGAKIAGRRDIASQIQTKVAALFKNFTEEVGIGEESEVMAMTTVVSKDVVSDLLRVTKTLKQDVQKESANVWRAYALMELNVGEMQAALLDRTKADKNLYTRFRASQGFKELEEEVEKYEAWKKEQGQG